MSPDVYYTQCDPRYSAVPLQADDPLRGILRSLWRAYGNDPDNPLQPYLSPGGSVVIKPNWVSEINRGSGNLDCLVTHPSIIQCVMEDCAKALEGRGRIILGDAPIQGCNFESLTQTLHLREVVESVKKNYPQLDIRINDWRLTVIDRKLHSAKGNRVQYHRQSFRDESPAIMENYVKLDLGKGSFLEEISDYADRFRVTMYKPSLLLAHHRPGVHQYLVRKEVLDADLLVNLAKMKTHQKAGLTGAMKNLVGVNGHKEYLPHHIKGSYTAGGDSYHQNNYFMSWAEDLYDRWWEQENELSDWQRWSYQKRYFILRALARLTGAKHISFGSWSGNETIWRMTLDLNHLLYFGSHRPKRIINIIDGIIAGEGNGPLAPNSKKSGLLLLGDNPAYLDAILARLMGYNIARIPTVYHAINHRMSKFGGLFLDELPIYRVAENGTKMPIKWREIESLNFVSPPHWQRAQIPRVH
ncbi:MAG: DUF362 domain-containing protein [Thermoguttaceae bacterium]